MEHRVSNNQLDELLDFLEANPAVATGVGLGSRSKEKIDREWDTLAESLNAHGGGSSKSGRRWKRYWADLKHKVKSRASERRREAGGTGGGSSTLDNLSETDKKVLAIIGKAAVFGDIEHRVPAFPSTAPCIPKTSDPATVPRVVNEEEMMNDSFWQTDQEAVIPHLTSPSIIGNTSIVATPSLPQTTQAWPPPPARDCENPVMMHGTANRFPVPCIMYEHSYCLSIVSGNTSIVATPSLPQTTQAWPPPPARDRESPVTRPRRITRRPRSILPQVSNVSSDWVIDLERRRVAAEEKQAEASQVIANASLVIADSVKTFVELSRMHMEAMHKILDLLKSENNNQ